MGLRERDVQQLSEALRELYAHTDAPTLPQCIVKLLHQLISADSAVYNSFDFRTKEMHVVHDHGPDGDKYLPALNEHVAEHPLMVHVRQHWRRGAESLGSVISKRELRDTSIYGEFLHPLRIEEQLGLLVEDHNYGVTAVGLQRSHGSFSPRDKAILTFLQPHIMQAFKNAADMTALRAQVAGMQGALNISDLTMLWLSHDHGIEWISTRAGDLLRAYFPNEVGRSLPPALADWINRQKAAQGAGEERGWSSSWTVAGARGRLHLRWICESPLRSYLMMAEERAFGPAEELAPLGLAPRETEVLGWVAEGKSNEAIALILGISKRTVDKHVENILRKLGVEGRVEAALKASLLRQK